MNDASEGGEERGMTSVFQGSRFDVWYSSRYMRFGLGGC